MRIDFIIICLRLPVSQGNYTFVSDLRMKQAKKWLRSTTCNHHQDSEEVYTGYKWKHLHWIHAEMERLPANVVMVVAVSSAGYDPFWKVVQYWIAQTSSLLHHSFSIISPICLQKKEVFSMPIASDVAVFLEMHEAPSDFHETTANCSLSSVLILLQYCWCCFAFLRRDLCFHPPTRLHNNVTDLC